MDLVDGASTTSTFGAITKTAGASAGIRFGVHRIAKTIEKNGKDQDRYAFLLRERKNPEGGDASASLLSTGGAAPGSTKGSMRLANAAIVDVSSSDLRARTTRSGLST